ncbi:MAG: bifunctional diaminohydroxyphosphoribosylaminopyrimidine deaminase/5-amino-6-(5-phosphoribosylamino)uracil reductase RibD [Hyphomicrobiales bacterium]|nr:bifunctional diaminohydroxyphosphoribosylaminopyrimidine deaminase/5-amino-6-(5-phosphoribosylamino)uracil reductase RibD [Hyphomicrobiales bacterium]MCP5373499.1 bifunctional diaminohydroxyphosphoribosylaminopyrimidine deaminase/5-amino-6-(5-phosphoribosylamino)uracil reductase RibD [Hyphomicrobiales bacterium]
MRAALALARRGLGRVWPNPAVGCVLVDPAGNVVGRGWTQPGGRPHAETEALARAGAAARGATAYVTLEPCDHHGQTPPCSQALVAAGIARAVVALTDPDPRVDGGGLATLRGAGIAVLDGVEAAAAAEVNAGFLLRLAAGRPLFTLKSATTLDGRIATAGGDSKWITGPRARAAGHQLRAGHDAIMVGIGTALADDPDLTVRLPGLEDRSPVRVVVDSALRLPPGGRLAATAAAVPTWVATTSGDGARRRALEERGVQVLDVAAGPDGRPDPAALAGVLGGRGLTRVLIEGGGRLAASFLGAGLVDRVAWFRAGRIIGGDGVSAVGPFGVNALADAPAFERRSVRELGADILETLIRTS